MMNASLAMMNASSWRTSSTSAASSPAVASTSQQLMVIGMGLPKTGTTSTANALVIQLGLRVAHNQGDMLSPRCDCIINTLEWGFMQLDKKHPNARWILTYSQNATAWLESVKEHMLWRRAYWVREKRPTFLPCIFFGCYMGLPQHYSGSADVAFPIDNSTGWLRADKELELFAAYERYYGRLFTHFRSVKYALVDVRQGSYHNLFHVHPNLTAPFPMSNTRSDRGSWPKCR